MTKGREGIYRRKDSPYFWICYKGLNKMEYESSRSTRKGDAKKLLDKRRAEVIDGNPTVNRKKNHTFGDLAEKYKRHCQKQKGFQQKRVLVEQLKRRFQNYFLRQFDLELLESYQDERIEKGNAPATINRHISTIKNMIRKSVDWKLVERDVMLEVRKIKMMDEENERVRYLNPVEWKRLLRCAAKHLRPIIIVGGLTGLRRGAILLLRWSQIDMENRVIFIQKTKGGKKKEVVIRDPLANLLSSLPRHINSDYVFVNPKTGKPYTDIKNAWQTALRKAKIEDFRFHDLRHTFASHLRMAGVKLEDLSELLGHSNLKMTQRYAHLDINYKSELVKPLEEILPIEDGR